ncbi:MAG: hypothetical protein SGJ05_06735 [bacterium]|nr:hypothetical protein [bacterium]
MEHKSLIVITDDHVERDNYPEFPASQQGFKIRQAELLANTQRMLHFTRSAIINFAWCVRWERLKALEGDSENPLVSQTFSRR